MSMSPLACSNLLSNWISCRYVTKRSFTYKKYRPRLEKSLASLMRVNWYQFPSLDDIHSWKSSRILNLFIDETRQILSKYTFSSLTSHPITFPLFAFRLCHRVCRRFLQLIFFLLLFAGKIKMDKKNLNLFAFDTHDKSNFENGIVRLIKNPISLKAKETFLLSLNYQTKKRKQRFSFS